jgi:hypothetical protein
MEMTGDRQRQREGQRERQRQRQRLLSSDGHRSLGRTDRRTGLVIGVFHYVIPPSSFTLCSAAASLSRDPRLGS